MVMDRKVRTAEESPHSEDAWERAQARPVRAGATEQKRHSRRARGIGNGAEEDPCGDGETADSQEQAGYGGMKRVLRPPR